MRLCVKQRGGCPEVTKKFSGFSMIVRFGFPTEAHLKPLADG